MHLRIKSCPIEHFLLKCFNDLLTGHVIVVRQRIRTNVPTKPTLDLPIRSLYNIITIKSYINRGNTNIITVVHGTRVWLNN